jgi:hypothetical protein
MNGLTAADMNAITEQLSQHGKVQLSSDNINGNIRGNNTLQLFLTK